MDKLKLAHEYALVRLTCNNPKTMDEIIHLSWYYADAMQAEAEKRVNKERPDVLKEEWQPDWSQAPEWANWWAMDLDSEQAHWYEVEPIADAIAWRRRTRTCKQAPSFNYQGNWQDSLRKRPQ